MKKPLIILVSLLLSNEVKSDDNGQMDQYSFKTIPMSKCLNYFEKGKVIHKSIDDQKKDVDDDWYMEYHDTLFSYKSKSYNLRVGLMVSEIHGPRIQGSKKVLYRNEKVLNVECEERDFDEKKN
tara:strand:+ start:61 stop:432 length:372 start_codon:yes stop_codon:yes gene_type:complete